MLTLISHSCCQGWQEIDASLMMHDDAGVGWWTWLSVNVLCDDCSTALNRIIDMNGFRSHNKFQSCVTASSVLCVALLSFSCSTCLILTSPGCLQASSPPLTVVPPIQVNALLFPSFSCPHCHFLIQILSSSTTTSIGPLRCS